MKTILAFVVTLLLLVGAFISFSLFSTPENTIVSKEPGTPLEEIPSPIFNSPKSNPSIDTPPISKPSPQVLSQIAPPPVIATTEKISTTSVITATTSPDRFVVPLSATTTDIVVDLLYDQGFIKSKSTFKLTLITRGVGGIEPGGYRITKGMSNSQIATILKGDPYMKWVLLKPGLRKEEIADILAETLEWSNLEKQKFLTIDTAQRPEYIEGVYFPDSYLIPLAETTTQVANRLINNFNTKFNPYVSKFIEENIKWTVALTMASIVQREAANNADMPLIARILWNRIENNMPLQVDATLQYARGDDGDGYWAPISKEDKEIDSPFNTYRNKGLPPRPISNPGMSAIEATLNPKKTDCLFYLHDKDRVTHCAVTFDEHKENVEKYLVE
jgi:UPF0755 protein